MFFRQDASPTFRGSSLPAKRYERLPYHFSNLHPSSKIIISVPSGELEFNPQRGNSNRKRDKTVTLNMGRTRVWNLTNNLQVKVHYCSRCCCAAGHSVHWCVFTPTCFDSVRPWCAIVAKQQLDEAAGGIVWASVPRRFIPGQHLSKFHVRWKGRPPATCQPSASTVDSGAEWRHDPTCRVFRILPSNCTR